MKILDSARDQLKKIDYCSGVPELNIAVPCCKNHDADYRIMGKFKADFRFLKCGIKKAQSYAIPHKRLFTYTVITTYYIGVSLFGWWAYYKAQRVA